MRRSRQVAVALLALGVAVAPVTAQQGQGKGPDKGGKAAVAQQSKQQGGGRDKVAGRSQGNDQAKARGNADQGRGRGNADKASAGRGNSGKSVVKAERGNSGKKMKRSEARTYSDRLPEGFRTLARSNRTSDRYVSGAATWALARGLAPGALALRAVNDRLEVRNRNGDVLFDMDEERARRMGSWNLTSLGDRELKEGAPAFCRSGAGHPVWGREWCLDKGFGLGRSNDRLWARTRVEDIIFGRRIEQDRLDRGSLIDVLGDIVFGRLAMHALTLGFDQPLVGSYVAEPNAPHLLLINAGNEPVAELVDLNGDNRVDVLYVSHY